MWFTRPFSLEGCMGIFSWARLILKAIRKSSLSRVLTMFHSPRTLASVKIAYADLIGGKFENRAGGKISCDHKLKWSYDFTDVSIARTSP